MTAGRLWRNGIFWILLSCPALLSAQQADDFFDACDRFLEQFVEQGLVNYPAIVEAPGQLDSLERMYSEMDLTGQPVNVRKAFWINAYNLAVIRRVARHYPVESPKAIAGFFNILEQQIGGKEMSLNELEKDELLDPFKDARLHFALICAARSCPTISPLAFRPEQLDQQLERQTRLALDDPAFIRLEAESEQIRLSEIFRWYVEDFDREGGIRRFINDHRSEPLPASFKLRYYPYDWTLNSLSMISEENVPIRYRASRLLDKRQFELKIFNALYTQKEFNGFERLNSRSTYFSSFIQYLEGSNRSFNYGFDLVLKANRVNDFADRSPFRAFRFGEVSRYQTFDCRSGDHNIGAHSTCHLTNEEGATDTLRSADGSPLKTRVAAGLSHFGPKIKFNPIKKWTDLSLQQTLYIPINKAVDGQTISFTQLFYDKPLGSHFQFFGEASLWTPVSPQFRIDAFVKGFFSYFPSRKWTVYVMSSIPYEYGIGTKYFLTQNLELEFLYTWYAPLEYYVGDTRPRTLNLGIRFFRQ